jgi:hypothetical protein
MLEAMLSSETSVLTRCKLRHTSEDCILHIQFSYLSSRELKTLNFSNFHLTIGVQIPAEAGNVMILHNVLIGFEADQHACPNDNANSFLGTIVQGRQCDPS